jgi:FkbM family methyltransferase
MRLQQAAAWGARALTPPAFTSIRESVAFGREHRLSSSVRDWVMGYRSAFRFGLHYLPPGFGLDGLIVDVGANRGDFAAMIRRLEPQSRVIAVEPAPGPRAELSARFANDPRVTIDERALSDHTGTATLHITRQSEYTSLLAPRSDMTMDRKEVDTTTLDNLISEPVRVLKIDVQGHEMPVLSGGAKTLLATDAVILETPFTSLYEGDAMFGMLDSAMREAGFVLAGLGEAHRAQGRAIWADACYLRAPPNRNRDRATGARVRSPQPD